MTIYKRNPDPRMKPPVGSILNLDHPLSRGLVGLWLMNEGGGSRIYDLSKDKRVGTVDSGSPAWHGDKVVFDAASSDRFNCGMIDMAGWAELSVITKANCLDNTVTRELLGNAKYGKASYYCNVDSYGRIYALLGTDAGSLDLRDTFIISLDTDYVIAHVFNKGQLIGYRDGSQFGTKSLGTALSPDNSSNAWFIGYNPRAAAYWTGDIYYNYIYNCALNVDEIAWLYAEPYANILQPQYWYMVDFGAAGGTSYDVSLSLTQALSLTDAGQATAEGAVSLSSSQGLSDGGLAAAEGALPLTHNQAITIQADAIGEASLSLAGTLILALSGNVPGFEASLDLTQSLGLVAAGDATAEGAFTLAYNLALQTAGGSTSEAVLSLAMSQGLTTDYIITIEGAVALAQSFGLTSTSDAIAEGQFNLSQLLAISTLAQAAAEAGISLGQVVSLTLTGTSVIAGLVTPEGRTYKISVEVRTLSIGD